MGMSNREIEVKLRFASASEAARRLESIGAVLRRPRRFEDNVVYDLPDGSLRRGDRVLRVRAVGDEGAITYKEPIAGDHRHKVRVEHETGVADAKAMATILERIGFAATWRYQKWRTVYSLGGLEIALDETPIGCFVELEGEPEEIDRVAAALGFSPVDFIRASYRELQEDSSGPEAGDLLLADAPDGGPLA